MIGVFLPTFYLTYNEVLKLVPERNIFQKTPLVGDHSTLQQIRKHHRTSSAPCHYSLTPRFKQKTSHSNFITFESPLLTLRDLGKELTSQSGFKFQFTGNTATQDIVISVHHVPFDHLIHKLELSTVTKFARHGNTFTVISDLARIKKFETPLGGDGQSEFDKYLSTIPEVPRPAPLNLASADKIVQDLQKGIEEAQKLERERIEIRRKSEEYKANLSTQKRLDPNDPRFREIVNRSFENTKQIMAQPVFMSATNEVPGYSFIQNLARLLDYGFKLNWNHQDLIVFSTSPVENQLAFPAKCMPILAQFEQDEQFYSDAVAKTGLNFPSERVDFETGQAVLSPIAPISPIQKIEFRIIPNYNFNPNFPVNFQVVVYAMNGQYAIYNFDGQISQTIPPMPASLLTLFKGNFESTSNSKEKKTFLEDQPKKGNRPIPYKVSLPTFWVGRVIGRDTEATLPQAWWNKPFFRELILHPEKYPPFKMVEGTIMVASAKFHHQNFICDVDGEKDDYEGGLNFEGDSGYHELFGEGLADLRFQSIGPNEVLPQERKEGSGNWYVSSPRDYENLGKNNSAINGELIHQLGKLIRQMNADGYFSRNSIIKFASLANNNAPMYSYVYGYAYILIHALYKTMDHGWFTRASDMNQMNFDLLSLYNSTLTLQKMATPGSWISTNSLSLNQKTQLRTLLQANKTASRSLGDELSARDQVVSRNLDEPQPLTELMEGLDQRVQWGGNSLLLSKKQPETLKLPEEFRFRSDVLPVVFAGGPFTKASVASTGQPLQEVWESITENTITDLQEGEEFRVTLESKTGGQGVTSVISSNFRAKGKSYKNFAHLPIRLQNIMKKEATN